MTPEKVLQVVNVFRTYFKEREIPEKQLEGWMYGAYENFTKNPDSLLSHCHWMLNDMERFVQEGRMEKCFRWLGFIQGCVFSVGEFTLNELKNLNRPNDETTV